MPYQYVLEYGNTCIINSHRRNDRMILLLGYQLHLQLVVFYTRKYKTSDYLVHMIHYRRLEHTHTRTQTHTHAHKHTHTLKLTFHRIGNIQVDRPIWWNS